MYIKVYHLHNIMVVHLLYIFNLGESESPATNLTRDTSIVLFNFMDLNYDFEINKILTI